MLRTRSFLRVSKMDGGYAKQPSCEKYIRNYNLKSNHYTSYQKHSVTTGTVTLNN